MFRQVVIENTVYLHWRDQAAPVYAIITGLHVTAIGILICLQLPHRKEVDVVIDGRKVAKNGRMCFVCRC